MSDKQEFHGATVAEALDRASTALGIDAGKLKFEVLDEGSTGFLGIGSRDARILVERAGSGAAIQASADDPSQQLESSDSEPVLPVEETQKATQPVEESHD